jgi:UvrD-like helicase C-terminal domain
VRRRDLLLGAGLTAPAVLLARVDSALAVMPAPGERTSAATVTTLLGHARDQFDQGRITQLASGLPGMLSAGHDLLDRAPGDERHLALLARCYHLACEGLHKSGSAQAARITADRAVTYARLSGDPSAEAMAARSTAVVLRHEGRQEAAQGSGRADGQPGRERDAIRVGTMHGMKGLEFQAVAVIGVAEGTVPAPSAVTSETADPVAHALDLQRERCVLFVACTRARDHLYVSYSGSPSPFLG